MRRSSGPEAVRTVQKVLLVDRLQQHDDRPLEDLVLQGGNSDGCVSVLEPPFGICTRRTGSSGIWTRGPGVERCPPGRSYTAPHSSTPTAQSSRMAVPRLHRYYQSATTSCRPSRRASLPSLGGTSVALACVRSSADECAAEAWSWSPGISGREFAEETTGSPKFLGNPIVRLHMF